MANAQRDSTLNANGLAASLQEDGTLKVPSNVAAWHSPIEELDVNQPLYDQGTYIGRLLHFKDMTYVGNAFATPAMIEAAKAKVDLVKQRQDGWKNVTVEEYRKSEALVGSAYGGAGLIPWPLRFSAFVPMNMVTLFFMLHPSQQTPLRGMFWQWWNQTYNCGVNFGNRGSPDVGDLNALAASYCLAVGISCSVSVLGGKFVAKMGSRMPAIARLLVPYVAVACASVANVVMVRNRDVLEGMAVQDKENGEEMGVSKVAGRSAVFQVGVSRVLLPLPLMTLPPLLSTFLFSRVGFFRSRRAKLDAPVNLGIIVCLLMGVVPACVAVYPQEAVLPVTDLEPEFQNRVDSKGQAITHVKFNKGL